MLGKFAHNRAAVAGLAIFSTMVAMVVAGPFFWQVGIADIDFTASLEGSSVAHPLGTDDLGQDLLARMLFGGRISLAVGVAAAIVATLIGIMIGAVAAYGSRAVDIAMMWFTDLFLSLPNLPLLLVVMYFFRETMRAAFGVTLGTFLLIVLVVGSLSWMSIARVVRAQLISLKHREFIEAAGTIGVPKWRLVVFHMLPNVMGPILVLTTIEVAVAIIAESSLSFLGLGFPSDVPTWGRLLYESRDFVDIAPHWALFSGGAIFLAVLSVNFIGDGLRDAFDPKAASRT
ncbi:ABC transporter permease [Mesorhizobium sp. CAU 1732]|uniref:ABC transporter permease n=1 Tax=Mesorhizobium sp. CAU 1732 TaxID=3140358 RepID=UPI003261BC6E